MTDHHVGLDRATTAQLPLTLAGLHEGGSSQETRHRVRVEAVASAVGEPAQPALVDTLSHS